MISKEKKTVFVHIPRTAGTSIEMLLEDSSSICKREQWGSFNAPLNHLTLAQLVEGNFISEMEMDLYFKFTIVRNPWDRIVSECFCPYIRNLFKDCKTITEKIELACSFAESGYGGHFLKQTKFIDSSNVSLDFIGRYENLSQDMNFLLNKIDQPQMTFEEKKDSIRSRYQEYYDPHTRKLVEKTYADEIELFGYCFETEKPS